MEDSMHADAYTRLILTIIAICLLMLALRATVGPVHAAAKTTCSGEMKPMGTDPIHASMSIAGSYQIKVTCE